MSHDHGRGCEDLIGEVQGYGNIHCIMPHQICADVSPLLVRIESKEASPLKQYQLFQQPAKPKCEETVQMHSHTKILSCRATLQGRWSGPIVIPGYRYIVNKRRQNNAETPQTAPDGTCVTVPPCPSNTHRDFFSSSNSCTNHRSRACFRAFSFLPKIEY